MSSILGVGLNQLMLASELSKRHSLVYCYLQKTDLKCGPKIVGVKVHCSFLIHIRLIARAVIARSS